MRKAEIKEGRIAHGSRPGQKVFRIRKSDPSSYQKNGTSVFAFGYAATRCRGTDAEVDYADAQS
jgi:hypothetical protein